MKAALLGLMQSGKSTIFSAISGKAIPMAGLNVIEEAIVPVPDERLLWLEKLYKPQKRVHATMDVLDLPGFSFTDEHGRTAARRLIGQIRTVDMLVLVVRAFEDPSVPPYRNSVNPKRDLAELQTELLLADLELVTRELRSWKSRSRSPPRPRRRTRRNSPCKSGFRRLSKPRSPSAR